MCRGFRVKNIDIDNDNNNEKIHTHTHATKTLKIKRNLHIEMIDKYTPKRKEQPTTSTQTQYGKQPK